MQRPLVVFTAHWVLGCVAAYVLQGWALIGVISATCLIVPILVYSRKASWQTIMVCLLGVCLSIGYGEWSDHRNISHYKAPEVVPESMVTIKGTLISKPEVDGDKVSVLLFVNELVTEGGYSNKGSEKVALSIKLKEQPEADVAKQWKRGDEISLAGKLRELGEATNFGGFNYMKFMRLKHIHWQLQVKGLEQVHVEKATHFGAVQIGRWNDQARTWLGVQLERIYDPDHVGYMKSLLFGIQDDMDPQQFQQFSKLGLTHILAISGLHVAVFVSGCLGGLRLLRLTRERSLTVTLILVPLYVLLTGGSPSAIRAGIMAMIALYAARLNLLKDGLHILCAAALLMLLWNPYYIVDVSFQLSYIVTLGLILGVPLVSRLLPIQHKHLNSAVSVTIVAQLISFPISIYYFNQFSLLSLVANFVLVPYISFLVLPLGTAALIIGFVYEAAGRWVAYIVEVLNNASFWFIAAMNKLTLFSTIWPSPSLIWIAIYYVVVICGLLLSTQEGETLSHSYKLRLNTIIALSLVCVVLLAHAYTPERWKNVGHINFIDVGQGDSIFIRTPKGVNLLIDGGGTVSFLKPGEEWRIRKDPYEVGAKLLVPLLKKRGVHVIDFLILSHEDTDHIGGLQAVLEQIPVKYILFNGTLRNRPNVIKLFQTAMDKHIPLLSATEGKFLKLDKYTSLQVLYPQDEDNRHIELQDEQNELSTVLLMTMYDSKFLFTGDMGFPSEDRVMEKWKQPADGVDVVKIAHHGSKHSTSEAWLQYWRPKSAVISVGAMNTYGHPNPGVIESLENHGSSVFRTDQHGEVQMQVSKEGIKVRTVK